MLLRGCLSAWVKSRKKKKRVPLKEGETKYLTVLITDRSFRLALKSLISSRLLFRSWASRLCAAAVSQGCRFACSTVIRLSTSTVRRLRMKSWERHSGEGG